MGGHRWCTCLALLILPKSLPEAFRFLLPEKWVHIPVAPYLHQHLTLPAECLTDISNSVNSRLNFLCSPLNLFPIQFCLSNRSGQKSWSYHNLPFFDPLYPMSGTFFVSFLQLIPHITSFLILLPSLLDPSSFFTKITGIPSYLVS